MSKQLQQSQKESTQTTNTVKTLKRSLDRAQDMIRTLSEGNNKSIKQAVEDSRKLVKTSTDSVKVVLKPI